jgi:eukaryotic-like serine/threonine-protein kinase
MERLALAELADRWADASAGALRPGARLGRYELLLPVGYGGMACVWAARLQSQRGFSKLVAIKTILPHLAHNPDFEKMLLDEASIAAKVHHPNVCDLYELGEEGRVLYLAMEWVNGDSLLHVLRAGAKGSGRAIEPRLVARIIADACAGLHGAHELADDFGHPLEVVHRDVSPHNILLSLEGAVKVADFGVAKARGQLHQPTRAGEMKGKLAYMAPEQITGPSIDRRADVFAMGCVLYEAIAGQQPFRGENDAQVIQAVLAAKYDPPGTAAGPCPPNLARIIGRALARQPADRFETAEKMRVALEEWLAASGPIVTATQVGNLVRERLGAQLDLRREQVRTAMSAEATRPVLRQGSEGPAGQPGEPTAGASPSAPGAGSAIAGIEESGSMPAGSRAPPTEPHPGPSSTHLDSGVVQAPATIADSGPSSPARVAPDAPAIVATALPAPPSPPASPEGEGPRWRLRRLLWPAAISALAFLGTSALIGWWRASRPPGIDVTVVAGSSTLRDTLGSPSAPVTPPPVTLAVAADAGGDTIGEAARPAAASGAAVSEEPVHRGRPAPVSAPSSKARGIIVTPPPRPREIPPNPY